MRNFGNLYVDTLKYPHRLTFPIIEKGWTVETDEPFRDGTCLVFRFPWTKKGLIIGLWVKGSEKDEEVALVKALNAKEVPLDDLEFKKKLGKALLSESSQAS